MVGTGAHGRHLKLDDICTSVSDRNNFYLELFQVNLSRSPSQFRLMPKENIGVQLRRQPNLNPFTRSIHPTNSKIATRYSLLRKGLFVS